MRFAVNIWNTGAFVLMLACSAALALETRADAGCVPTRDLSRFFAKLREGKPVVVMGIGGSVTEGESWAPLSVEWLRQQNSGAQIHYVDGAYGGTPPWQTVFRMKRDILPHHPDMVFIEYAVNSYDPKERCWLALDGIIQQLLNQPQRPDIVFVYVGIRSGYRELDRVQPVAQHYGFPEVDARAFLQTKIDSGELKWQDISPDDVHPNPRGHGIYAEAMVEFLKRESQRREVAPVPPVPPPYRGMELASATILPIQSIQLPPVWETIAPPEGTRRFFDKIYATDQPGATLVVTVDNTTVMGLYLIQTTDSGQIEWSVDGGRPHKRDLWMPWLQPGQSYARAIILAEGLPPGSHTLTIKVLSKNKQSKGNWVRIGGFCVTNPQS